MLSRHKVDASTQNPYFSRSPQVFPHLWINITGRLHSYCYSCSPLSPYPFHLQDILSPHRRSSTMPSMTREPSMSLRVFSFFFLYLSPTTALSSLFSYSISSIYNSEKKNTSPCDNAVRFKNKRNQPVIRNTIAARRGGALCYAIDRASGKVRQCAGRRKHDNHGRAYLGRCLGG